MNDQEDRMKELFGILCLVLFVTFSSEAIERKRPPQHAPKPTAAPPQQHQPGTNNRQGSAEERDAIKAKLPKPTPEQQQTMHQMQTDLKALGQSASQSKDEVQKLGSDLSSMVDNPPDQALVQD